MSDLVLYVDAEFTKPFTIENIGDVDAGSIKIIEGYLKNESQRDIVQIETETFDDDIKVIDYPEQLPMEKWQKVSIRYSPKETRTTPLNTFITFWGKKRIPPE